MAYPKKYLSPDGMPVLAKQAVHEAELLAQGYTLAPVELTAPQAADSPTPCAKCAELEATINRLEHAIGLAAAGEPQTGETPKPPRARKAKV